jgi:hypothetical protein
MALHDKEQQEADREDGMVRERPAVVLLKHLADLWPDGQNFLPTSGIVRDLATQHPDEWGANSPFGKALTAQRLGRMLATSYGVNSGRPGGIGPRGYTRGSLATAWNRMGIAPPSETGGTGETGETGYDATVLMCLDCGLPLPATFAEIGYHHGCGEAA